MSLSIDDRGVTTERCAVCAADYLCVTGYVRDGDDPAAVYFAALHGHEHGHEAWVDVTLAERSGAPGGDEPRVTFCCRLGDFGSHGGLGATLSDEGLAHEAPSVYGRRLTAEEALADRRLERVWAVVDLLLAADPDVHTHVHT